MSRTVRTCHAVAVAALTTFASVSTAHAGETESWSFDETTSGEDIGWTSPTSVRTDAAEYLGEWEITLVEVVVLVFGLPITVDVTDQIPPEQQMGASSLPGPAPFLLLDDSVIFPDPPEPPSVAADLQIGVDGDGFGYFTGTNVILGEVDTGIFGVLPIESIRVAGNVMVTPIGLFGDITGDGVIDFGDILAVLSNWGACPAPPADCPADIDGDLVVGFADLLGVLSAWTG